MACYAARQATANYGLAATGSCSPPRNAASDKTRHGATAVRSRELAQKRQRPGFRPGLVCPRKDCNVSMVQQRMAQGEVARPNEQQQAIWAAGWAAGHTAADQKNTTDSTIVADLIHQLTADAYEQGRRAGIAEGRNLEKANIGETIGAILARDAEFAAWLRDQVGAPTREQRIAGRIADMEKHADELNRRLGRPTGYRYTGGPVDWNTGRPLTSNNRTAEMRAAA